MNLYQTINQTKNNIKSIREYLEWIENNNVEKAGELSCINHLGLDDIDNDIQFIRDYNAITNELLKILKTYYGDR